MPDPEKLPKPPQGEPPEEDVPIQEDFLEARFTTWVKDEKGSLRPLDSKWLLQSDD